MTPDLANWMSPVQGSKKLSELSIPGTHDSASTLQPDLDAGVRLRLSTQTRGLRAQLEGGIRFLDLRCGIVEGKSGLDEFELYHEKHLLGLSFSAARNICREFLSNHPRETIVVSVKEEDDVSKGDPARFQKVFNRYVGQTPSLWFLDNRIPALAEVRGKLVLFRRFRDVVVPPSPSGINAFGKDKEGTVQFPNDGTGTIDGPPRLRIQDKYSLRGINDTIEAKRGAIEDLLRESTGPKGERGTLYVNYTSAAGTREKDYPINAASYLNPRLALYFRDHINGPFGILPRDFEAIDFRTAGNATALDETNSLIVRANTDYFFLKNRNTSVVDFKDGADGTTLIAYKQKSSGMDNQVVEFILSDTPPYFYLANRQTGTVIDIQGPTPAPGSRLIAAARKTPASDSQLWMLIAPDQSGEFFIASKIRTAGVITVGSPSNGETPLIISPAKTDAQRWTIPRPV